MGLKTKTNRESASCAAERTVSVVSRVPRSTSSEWSSDADAVRSPLLWPAHGSCESRQSSDGKAFEPFADVAVETAPPAHEDPE